MKNLFIPYELALELKKLGFNKPCFGEYHNGEYDIYEDEIELVLVTSKNKGNFPMQNKCCTAPLYQQAFLFFREKHKLQAEIIWRGDMGCFCYKTGKFKQGSHDFSIKDYKTYEEAELGCLIKLIQIIK